jgi:hypothetical protein
VQMVVCLLPMLVLHLLPGFNLFRRLGHLTDTCGEASETQPKNQQKAQTVHLLAEHSHSSSLTKALTLYPIWQ